MYRKPYMDQLERVQKLGRRELAEQIRDITGWTQNESQTAIEAVTLAVQIWLEAMIQTLPENAKAEISITGFGSFVVSNGISFRPGSGNRTRRRLGLPPVPKMEVNFLPSKGLTEQLKEINRQSKIAADSIIEGKVQEGRNPQHQEKIAHR
jgi:nucleoid DNA-binding protein